MDGLTAVLVALLTAPIASLATWFFNRKKDEAGIWSSISEAGQTAVETVTAALETVNTQLDQVKKENAQLHIDLCDLKKQNAMLMEENKKLRDDLRDLKNQNQELMQQVHDMRVSYEQSQQHDS